MSQVEAEANSNSERMPFAQYKEILDEFTFGETRDNTTYSSSGTITLDIKAGFNILQWDKWEDIEADASKLELYKGVLTVTKTDNGTGRYQINASDIKFVTVTQDPEQIARDLANVKNLR